MNLKPLILIRGAIHSVPPCRGSYDILSTSVPARQSPEKGSVFLTKSYIAVTMGTLRAWRIGAEEGEVAQQMPVWRH